MLEPYTSYVRIGERKDPFFGFGRYGAATCRGDSGAPIVNPRSDIAYGMQSAGARVPPCGGPAYFPWIITLENNTDYRLLVER